MGNILNITPIINGIKAAKFKIRRNLIAFPLPSITGSVFNPSFESVVESFKSKNIAFIIPFMFIKMNIIRKGKEMLME